MLIQSVLPSCRKKILQDGGIRFVQWLAAEVLRAAKLAANSQK